MTKTLPVHPDFEHLRRDARRLLEQLRANEDGALARLAANAPELPVALSSAQLVVAREYGFSSWAQLKALVGGLTSDGVRYDRIGRGYSDYRRADPRIASVVHEALGDARTVVNVGAGTGSYEPVDRPVIPIEPSTAMAMQRDPARAPAVFAVAESLPLADNTTDCAMAILTMHHWADLARGLSEMVRIARKRIVLLTMDVDVQADMWLFRDYTPEVVDRDRREFPTIDHLISTLPGTTRAVTVPVPADCTDGFMVSFWSRPEMILEPGARAATSGFARMDEQHAAEVANQLRLDLATGAWDERNGHLRTLTELDAGLRVVICDLDK